MIYKKTMIKKIEEETGMSFICSETNSVLYFRKGEQKKYFLCNYKEGTYQEWNPKTGIIRA